MKNIYVKYMWTGQCNDLTFEQLDIQKEIDTHQSRQSESTITMLLHQQQWETVNYVGQAHEWDSSIIWVQILRAIEPRDSSVAWVEETNRKKYNKTPIMLNKVKGWGKKKTWGLMMEQRPDYSTRKSFLFSCSVHSVHKRTESTSIWNLVVIWLVPSTKYGWRGKQAARVMKRIRGNDKRKGGESKEWVFTQIAEFGREESVSSLLQIACYSSKMHPIWWLQR